MSTINYTSRYHKAVFCEGDIANSAKRAMLFVNFEYNAGGEPVFRSTKLNVRENLRSKRFLAQLRRDALRRRIRAQRRTGGRKYLPIKTRIELAANRQKNNSTPDRVVWGR